MSISVTTVQSLSSEVAPFFFKKLGQSYLITNEFGYFSYLTDTEFEDFCTGEIKNQEKLRELTEKLFLKNDAYLDQAILAYNKKNSFLAFGPTLHIIVPTLRCNHKCQYCHAAVAPMTAKNFDMSLDTARKVVDTIFFTSSPSLTIEFQGGETLVNWEVVQFVVDYARVKAEALKKHITFSIVTNLSLMTEEKLEWLIDHGVDICTSLDGDKLIHNTQRVWKEGNSYEKLESWVYKIREEYSKRGMNPFRMGALPTWTRNSINEYKRVIDTYITLGFSTVGLRWLNPYGFAAAEKEALEYSTQEYFEFYKNAMEYIIEKNKAGIELKEMLSAVYLYKIFHHTDSGFMDVRSPSGLAIGCVAYNYDGKVYASDESRMLARMGIEDFCLTPLLATGEDTYKAMAASPVTNILVQASTLDGLPGYIDHVYKPYIGVDILYAFTQHGNIFSHFSKDDKTRLQISMLDYIFEKMQDPEIEKIFRSWVGA